MCKQWSCYWHDKDNSVKVAPHKLKMVLPTLTWTFYYTLDQILCTKREKSIGKERKKGSIYLSIQKWKPAHSIQLPSIYIQGSIFTFSQSHQPGSKPHGIHTCSLVTIWVARTKVQNCIYKECVVPENIQIPTTEGISLRTPLPTTTTLDLPFLRGNDDPPPLRNFHKCNKDPSAPLESSF